MPDDVPPDVEKEFAESLEDEASAWTEAMKAKFSEREASADKTPPK